MLFISGTDLESSAIKFVEAHEKITLFSAYLKLEELKKINRSKSISRIVVRWEIKDLCLGVSDLELYDYCEENKISLHRNTRLHLKAFWNNIEAILFGSANVTERGLGEAGNYNYELNGLINQINLNTAVYLNKIILESEFVSFEVYNKIKDLVDTYNLLHEPEPEYPTLNFHVIDDFLLSNLPMSENVEVLFNAYRFSSNLSSEEKTCAAHDLALYKIPSDLDEKEFYTHLETQFNRHPFIISIKNMIMQYQSVRYGGVVRWIQENTTTVPTPRSWELKQEQIVNILYEWICYFDQDFSWSRPNHSQVIFYRKVYDDFESFLERLKRDKARGNLAPHQVILIISLYRLFQKQKESKILINELAQVFGSVWKEYQSHFKSRNSDLMMPLKALFNQNYITTYPTHININIYRSFSLLPERLEYLILNDELKNYLELPNLEPQLIEHL